MKVKRCAKIMNLCTRRQPRERAAVADGAAHSLGARAQSPGRRLAPNKSAMGRRETVPGSEKNRHRQVPAHHLQ